MSKLDIESLLTQMKGIYQANLNTKIAEIQAEKDTLLGADNFTIPTIDDNAWFDALDERVLNYDPFVYYNVQDLRVIQSSGATGIEGDYFFTVVLHYDADDTAMFNKMLRYIRALIEITEENTHRIAETSDLQINVINPDDIQALDGDTFHKIGGVSITTAFY